MPVDLSPAGRPSAYPARMRFWPWALTWFVCNVFGPVVVLLAWPKSEPASGLRFWGLISGVPNGLFLVLLGFGRAGYEGLWYRAYWRNHHRDRWLAKKIGFAQRPLYVLDAGYCLPLGGTSLSDVLIGKRSIMKVQARGTVQERFCAIALRTTTRYWTPRPMIRRWTLPPWRMKRKVQLLPYRRRPIRWCR